MDYAAIRDLLIPNDQVYTPRDTEQNVWVREAYRRGLASAELKIAQLEQRLADVGESK